MKVSVIIPAHNEQGTIGECLESLTKQSFKDVEVIVVDDGSSDDTVTVAKRYGVKVLKRDHFGPGAARNLGARHSKGENLVFVDADMTFEPHFIEILVAPIIEGKTRGTFSQDEYVANWDNLWAKCWNINEGWEPKKRHLRNYPNEQKVFRAVLKSEFNRVGGFDPVRGYNDDWSLSEKLGYPAVSVPGAVFYHRNPETLGEIFRQAKWIGKRPYKLGLIGVIIALFRASFPVSLVIGFLKAIGSRQPAFILFKIVYDFGIFVGIIEKIIFKKTAR